jgi:hypothetical protein
MSTTQKMALTPAELSYLSGAQTSALGTISPLVLDLTGSGVQTVGIGQSGVQFDLNNSGVNASVGWITQGEGFLVDLPAGSTTITNGSQLFGSATLMPNGQTASNGFAALSAFDTNNSGVIDASDPIFNQLQVWVNTGTQGTTPVGTLFTLAQLNIQSLNLKAVVTNQESNGNTVGMISSYTTTNGQTFEMADVWLSSTAATSSASSQLTQILNQYSSNPASFSGGVTSNTQSASLTNALGTALTHYSGLGTAATTSAAVLNNASQLVSTALPASPTMALSSTKNTTSTG